MFPIVKVWCGEGREAQTAQRLKEAGLPVALVGTGRVYARVPNAAPAPDDPVRTLIEALRYRHGTAFGLDDKPRLCALVPEDSPMYWNLAPGPAGVPRSSSGAAARRGKPRRHRRGGGRKTPC
jgi:hypothetical protein